MPNTKRVAAIAERLRNFVRFQKCLYVTQMFVGHSLHRMIKFAENQLSYKTRIWISRIFLLQSMILMNNYLLIIVECVGTMLFMSKRNKEYRNESYNIERAS